MALYDGPVIDAHHHLWTFDPGEFPWLAGPDNRAIARDFTAADYLAAAGDLDIVASVWIEAVAADPLKEALAAVAVHREISNVCNAVMAHVPLDVADVGARLDQLQASVPTLRGIRDIVAAQPGQDSFARRPDLMSRPEFERGLRELAARGLIFELMLEPWQMGEALRLAGKFPGLAIIIEHAGNPDFSTIAGTALWRDAMRAAAEHRNVSLKISALHCRMPDWTDARLAGPIRELIGWFGVDRLAFASDFPVHDRSCPFARAFETFRLAVTGLPAADQRALFHDTAQRLYRL